MHGALPVQSEQGAHAAIAPRAGTERQQRAVRVIAESWKQRQSLEVGLLLLAIPFGNGQRAVEQTDQMTGLAVRHAKHAEVKLVVCDHVDEGLDAREPAGGAQMQRPTGAAADARSRLADLGDGDHSSGQVMVVLVQW